MEQLPEGSKSLAWTVSNEMSYQVTLKWQFSNLKLLYLKHCGQCHCEDLYSVTKNQLDWHPWFFLSLPFILEGNEPGTRS